MGGEGCGRECVVTGIKERRGRRMGGEGYDRECVVLEREGAGEWVDKGVVESVWY